MTVMLSKFVYVTPSPNRNYEAILYRFRDIIAYFQKLKWSHDSDHAPFRDSLSSVGWDLP